MTEGVSVPQTGGVIVTHRTQQLTLRDQFAMVALTGIVANPDYDLYNGDKARLAYEIADAMLKERKKKK